MKELKVNWGEAPEGANVALFEDGILEWWLDANFEEDTYRFCTRWGRRWMDAPGLRLKQILDRPNRAYVKKPEPYVFNAKKLKKTEAYQQLKRFIAANNGTPADLGLLVKRVLQRVADHVAHVGDIKPGPKRTLGSLFVWAGTPEGHNFWEAVGIGRPVDNLHPCPIKPKKEKVVAKPQKPIEEKPKRVGWW